MLVWQYERLDLNQIPRKQSEIDVLNQAGQDGWELVTITVNNWAILKRQINAPTSQKTGNQGRVKERQQQGQSA